MKFVLWGGPFDGFEHHAPAIAEFIELHAPATNVDDITVKTPVRVYPATKYLWRASRARYEWEGIRNGQ